jgi:hypothetical protein
MFTGVETTDMSSLMTLYPNPTTDKIRLSLGGIANGVVEVLDATGRTVLQQNASAVETELDLSRLPVGVYEVKVNAPRVTASGRIAVSR